MEVDVTFAVKALSPGKMTAVEASGQSILVANVNGDYFAVGNICTHRGCHLSEGILTGTRVQCPCHGSTFDVTTGSLVRGPAKNPEPSFKINVRGDEIAVNI